jgi:DNA-binding LacI/PurR family transcriptional regulator
VEVDDVAIAVKATEHLLELGHTRIGMIRTSDTEGARWTSDLHRSEGYLAALRSHGFGDPGPLHITETYGVHAGARGLGRLLDLDEPPTAVLCYSDDIAISALRAAQLRGLRVPEDVSLVGIDGHPMGELFGITTVDQHVREQARVAGEMALRLLSGRALDRPAVIIESDLVVRSSTAPPPSG